jgi:hypothetical protein
MLVKQGHFTPMKGCVRGGRKIFPVAEVESWLAKLASKASDAALEWLPLPRACRIAQAPYAVVISAALAGDVRTRRLEEEGLASVGVLLHQIRQYTLKRRYRSAAKR